MSATGIAPNTPYPGNGNLHDLAKLCGPVFKGTHMCLSTAGLEESHFPPPYGDGTQFVKPPPPPPGKEWVLKFWELSYGLFQELSKQNGIVLALNRDYVVWTKNNPKGNVASFVRQPGPAHHLDNYLKALGEIRKLVGQSGLAWPPIPSNDLPAAALRKAAMPTEAGCISNNGTDIPGVDPITFDVLDDAGAYQGRAYIIFTQDCEWLNPLTARWGPDWLSWGIVASFSVKLVSNEITPSFSSSSSRYSTSSQLPP
jgi:hypothetical protein